jgi:hypothetical protein
MANPEDLNDRPTGEILTVKTLFCPLKTKRTESQGREVQAVAEDNVCLLRSFGLSADVHSLVRFQQVFPRILPPTSNRASLLTVLTS